MHQKTNKIHSLKIDKGVIHRRVIHNHILQHIKKLFGQNNQFQIRMNEGSWNKLIDTKDLQGEFLEEEIKRAVQELAPDKALDPDGFPLIFFRKFWSEVKDNLKWLVNKVFRGEARLERINYSIITLIPKKGRPKSIEDYMPIALLTVH